MIGSGWLEVEGRPGSAREDDPTLEPQLVLGDGEDQAEIDRRVERRRLGEGEVDPGAMELLAEGHELLVSGNLDPDLPAAIALLGCHPVATILHDRRARRLLGRGWRRLGYPHHRGRSRRRGRGRSLDRTGGGRRRRRRLCRGVAPSTDRLTKRAIHLVLVEIWMGLEEADKRCPQRVDTL